MNTCVLPFRRRNAFEWTIRSRSRWKGVRTAHSGSGRLAAARLVRADGERRERALLVLADAFAAKASATLPAISGIDVQRTQGIGGAEHAPDAVPGPAPTAAQAAAEVIGKS